MKYLNEINDAYDRKENLYYKVPYVPLAMKPGDRCYVCHRNAVRGYMDIIGATIVKDGFTCSSTGKFWGPGKYIVRKAIFHRTMAHEMKGFQGIRRYEL